MNKTILSSALILLVALHAMAYKRPLNTGWMFTRLSDSVTTWEAQNQGTSWDSQFSVTAVEGGTQSSIAVPEATIAQEQRQLSQAHWQQVRLPHTAFIEPKVIKHPWQGICYYTRKVTVSHEEAAKQLWVEFEGAMQLADVWINGRHVFQHAGGFTPFVIDATGVLHEGDNDIIVRLDNRDNALIPPGKPLSKLDFCYHSGLYRGVSLIVKAPQHITNAIMADKVAGGGIFVTFPTVGKDRAVVNVKTEVANEDATNSGLQLRQTLYLLNKGKRGKKVAETVTDLSLAARTAQTVNQSLTVTKPRLWYPDCPSLYLLVSAVMKDGRVIDSEETRIGIHRYTITKERGLEVNGKPYYLCGTNRHQEYPYVGNALPDNAQYRDMYQIRNNGYNIVRLGHYPQATSALYACDELGLLAIEPTPGWQFYNKDSLFNALTFKNIRDMIRRDRNHPCILMWETTLNESWPPTAWKDRAVQVAHEEMPGDQCFTSGDSYGYSGFDVCYNDWDDKTFSRPNRTSKPAFIREYYDYEFGGHRSTTRVGLADGPRALMQNLWNAQWSYNQYRKQYPGTIGGAVWSMYDYNRGCADNICESGVADVFRRAKWSLPFYRLQVPAREYTPAGPMPYEVMAATNGILPSDTLMVMGNVDEVEINVDGQRQRQGHDAGPDTRYVSQPDGGNASHLPFAPFTFKGVNKDARRIIVTGYASGRKVAEEKVLRPGDPRRLRISYFKSGRDAGREDLIIVYADLVDANGTVCPINGKEVRIAVSGGEVVGPSSYRTDAGSAAFLVQTSDASRLRLDAACEGMTGSLSLRLK